MIHCQATKSGHFTSNGTTGFPYVFTNLIFIVTIITDILEKRISEILIRIKIVSHLHNVCNCFPIYLLNKKKQQSKRITTFP